MWEELAFKYAYKLASVMDWVWVLRYLYTYPSSLFSPNHFVNMNNFTWIKVSNKIWCSTMNLNYNPLIVNEDKFTKERRENSTHIRCLSPINGSFGTFIHKIILVFFIFTYITKTGMLVITTCSNECGTSKLVFRTPKSHFNSYARNAKFGFLVQMMSII